MAFDRDNLCRIGGSGNSRAVWVYASTEAVNDVLADDFFLPATAEITKGDIFFIVDRVEDAPELADVTISFCTIATGATVKMASGTAIGNS